MTDIHTSLHGRKVGLSRIGRLITNLEGDAQQMHGGVVYTNTAASTAISNSAAEALFDTNYTVPANVLQPGMMLKIRFQGIATATNSTDTLTIKLRLGGLSGTALLTSSATDATNNDIFEGECTVLIRTVGASGTFVAVGSFTKVEAASNTATRVSAITASTAIDTTVTQSIGVSATWSNASSSNSCRLDIMAVEMY